MDVEDRLKKLFVIGIYPHLVIILS